MNRKQPAMTFNNRSYNNPQQKSIRRELRTHGTPAEARLWSLLKRRQVEGALFRRQYSVDTYILDFYCPAARLCIELDGVGHYSPDGIFNDGQREEYLFAKHGIRTLRFENREIFEQPELVIEAIRQALREQRK